MKNRRKQYLQKKWDSPPTASKCGQDIYKTLKYTKKGMRLTATYQFKTKIHTARKRQINRQASSSNTQ